MAAGWTFPGQARKAHAFDTDQERDKSTSLCGHWMFMSVLRPGFEFDAPLTAQPSKDDCVPCTRAIKKRGGA